MMLLARGTGVDVGAGDSAHLDCVNDNIAVLLDFYGVGDTWADWRKRARSTLS